MEESNRLKDNNRKTGAQYEQKAGLYLTSLGYEILEFNYRCRMGEIDIIAKDGEYLVFCEVKYRKNRKKGHPLEAVGVEKQRVITKCAMYYLTVHRVQDVPCRFDVVAVEGETVTHIKNAFDALYK